MVVKIKYRCKNNNLVYTYDYKYFYRKYGRYCLL